MLKRTFSFTLFSWKYIGARKEGKNTQMKKREQYKGAVLPKKKELLKIVVRPVILVSYDSRYESYDTVRVQAKAMRTMLLNRKLHVSPESLRYDGTIRVSYRIERYIVE
jgi:hypothetical protein